MAMSIKYEKCRVEETDCETIHSNSPTEEYLLEYGFRPISNSRRNWYPSASFVITHTCYVVIYSFLAYIACQYLSKQYHGPDLIYSPARQAVEYEVHPGMDDYDNASPYFGEPRPELEQAWKDLVQYTPIILSDEEFRHYNKDGILLSDNSGYLSTITMYHDMHCIQYLYQTLWADHYFPNQAEADRIERRDHSEHCLMNLKHGVMCHGDITVRTMRWENDKLLPVATDNPHECVNAKKIDDWMKSRTVEAWKHNLLIHPILGPSFPQEDVDV